VTGRLSPEDVERIAGLAGVRVVPQDLEALAAALASHAAFVEPLLRLDLSAAQPALAFDPRWRD